MMLGLMDPLSTLGPLRIKRWPKPAKKPAAAFPTKEENEKYDFLAECKNLLGSPLHLREYDLNELRESTIKRAWRLGVSITDGVVLDLLLHIQRCVKAKSRQPVFPQARLAEGSYLY